MGRKEIHDTAADGGCNWPLSAAMLQAYGFR